MDESVGAARRAETGSENVDRLEALEQQVRQLTSRLAGWVEAQLVQAMDDRRNDLKALRSELVVVVDEQLAGVRAETASVLSVATHRIDVGQEQLAERLEAVAQRAADAAATASAATTAVGAAGTGAVDRGSLDVLEQRVGARLDALARQVEVGLSEAADARRADIESLREEVEAGGSRAAATDGLELRVRQAMGRLTESVEAQLAELHAGRQADLDGLRRDLAGRIDEHVDSVASRSGAGLAAVEDRLAQQVTALAERLDEVARQAAAAAERVTAAASESAAGVARTDAFEQRVKSAMGRLTDSVETRLAESAGGGQEELERLRAAVGNQVDAAVAEAGGAKDAAIAALDRSQAGIDRMEALEQQVKAALARLGESVDAKVAEVVVATKVAGDALLGDLRAETAEQLRDARAEVGAAIDASNKRLAAAQEGFDERARALADQASSVTGSIEILDSTVASDGARLEALELHTRRTDAKLTELVEERFAVLASGRGAELDQFRGEMEAAVANELGQLRAEVSAALGGARQELVVATNQLAAQGVEMHAAAVASAAEAKADLGSTLEAARVELALGSDQLSAQRAELDAAVAVHLARARAELASTLDRARAQRDELRVAVDVQVAEARAELAATLGDAHAELARSSARIEEGQARLATQAAEAAAAVQVQVELIATVESLGRKANRAQDRTRKLAERVEDLAAALARAGSAESVALAPLRSDIRMLHAQLAELADGVGGTPPRRKADAAPRGKVTAAEKVRAVAARKAIYPPRTGTGPARPASRRPAQ